MKLRRVACLLMSCLSIAAGPAFALAQRTFVASYGLDTNACSVAAPCRTFNQALTQTIAGGEIIVVDAAGYGPVVIGKSVSIVVPAGIYAGISVASGIGVDINGAGIEVSLTGLTITGLGGTYGIRIMAAQRVSIDRADISGFSYYGIWANSAGELFVRDTRSSNNFYGIYMTPTLPNELFATVERSTFETNDRGIYVDNYTWLALRDSTFARNAGYGLRVYPDAGETVWAAVERCTFANNGIAGVSAFGAGLHYVTVADSLFLGHIGSGHGALEVTSGSPGVVYTLGNNRLLGNSATVVGGGGVVSMSPF